MAEFALAGTQELSCINYAGCLDAGPASE